MLAAWLVWTLARWVAFVGAGLRVAVADAPAALPSIRVDVNRAPLAVLALLPGLGPRRAGAVVLYRVRYGRFARLDDLVAVDGIGPATVAGLREVATAGVGPGADFARPGG